MLKKIPLSLLAVLAVATMGHADVFSTGTETANQAVLGGATSFNVVTRVDGTSFGGFDFGNDITSAAGPNVKDIVNVVTVDQITSYNRNAAPSNPLSNFGANTAVLVFAGQLKVTSVVGSAVQAQVLNGSFGIFQGSQATYDPKHAATWNATGVPVALYSLSVPITVIPGPNGQGDFFPAGNVNVAAFNTNAIVQSQAVLLFNEVSNGGFLVVDSVPGQTGVGQVAQTEAQLQTANLPILSAADQAALNTIFNNLDTGASLFGFATFGSGTATDFLPNGTASTGDADQSFGVTFDPGNFLPLAPPPVPEIDPSSIAGALTLLGGGLVYLTERRRRNKK